MNTTYKSLTSYIVGLGGLVSLGLEVQDGVSDLWSAFSFFMFSSDPVSLFILSPDDPPNLFASIFKNTGVTCLSRRHAILNISLVKHVAIMCLSGVQF